MKLTPAAFSTKWKQRFVPNDEFKITAADLQEFTQDTADSFGVSVANVPAYVAGSTYAVGYLVRFGSAQGRESFYYALKAGLLPAPTYQVSDANWKLVPGPVAPTVFTQAITLLEAGGIEGAGVAVRLYAIEGSPIPNVSNPEVGCWNQDGQTRTIYVWGYENWWGKLGVLLDGDGRPQEEVEVDVAAGTYKTRVIGGGSGDSYTKAQVDAKIQSILDGDYTELIAGFSPGYSDTMFIYPFGRQIGVYQSMALSNVDQVSFFVQRKNSPGYGVSSLPLTLFDGDSLQVSITRNNPVTAASVLISKQP